MHGVSRCVHLNRQIAVTAQNEKPVAPRAHHAEGHPDSRDECIEMPVLLYDKHALRLEVTTAVGHRWEVCSPVRN